MGYYVFTESLSQGAGACPAFGPKDLEVRDLPIMVDALIRGRLFFNLYTGDAEEGSCRKSFAGAVKSAQ